jgi:cytochrome c553
MMKILIAIFSVSLFAASIALADDTTVLKSPNAGNVTFTHKKHQERDTCTTCHKDEKGGKIETLAKKADAHNLCKGCHEAKKAGPTKCGECHKKDK